MTDRRTAPPGAGRALLAEADRRLAAYGRELCRLDCLTSNARLRRYDEEAGYLCVAAPLSALVALAFLTGRWVG